MAAAVGAAGHARTQPPAGAALVGVQDPAWAPDGRRIAVSSLDTLWIMAPDGKTPSPLVRPPSPGVERDPAFSPDGTRVAFAADRGTGFDLNVAAVRDGSVTPVTTLPGDERWPSWTPDGGLVFGARAPRAGRPGADPGARWDLHVVRPVD